MLYLLYTNLTFFDSFLVFWEYFQLRHVSSFILDQYLIAVNFLKKIRFNPCKTGEPLPGMELQEKEAQKDLRIQNTSLERIHSE